MSDSTNTAPSVANSRAEATHGDTPMHRLAHVGSEWVDILGKCEFMNPTGSHKDRVFGFMLDDLAAQGKLKPGMTVVECSTGNGGAALARAGKARGYEVVIIMPEGMTAERLEQIRTYGATVIETSARGFLLESENRARAYVRDHDGAYFLDQSTNSLNWKAWRACGIEMREYCVANHITPDAFVCSVGTGGTFTGIADVLRASFPTILTVALEVDRSAPLYAEAHHTEFVHKPHNLMGLGGGKRSGNLREELVDRVELVSGDEAWSMMHRLVAEEDLPVGPTAGANVVGALKTARHLNEGAVILTVFFDSSWKYKSIWDGTYAAYPVE